MPSVKRATEFSAGFIAAIVFGLMLVLSLLIVGYVLWRRRNSQNALIRTSETTVAAQEMVRPKKRSFNEDLYQIHGSKNTPNCSGCVYIMGYV